MKTAALRFFLMKKETAPKASGISGWIFIPCSHTGRLQERVGMNKGIFWFPCFMGTEGELVFTGEIAALPFPCGEDGNPKVSTPFR